MVLIWKLVGPCPYTWWMQFSFRNDQLEECCLIATGAAGNFMFCRSYLTEFYGPGAFLP